ncbi:MAG: SOUL family heme-binding protein [Myxococcaceae bacterium]
MSKLTVEASHAEAGNEGFRRLAGYIFGKNKGARRIAMTAPVAEARATRIAMTAPVAEVATDDADRFLIQFMMPSDFTLDTLPESLDERIHFRQVPARRVAAIRYSGTWSERRYQAHLQKLRAAMREQGLAAAAEPVWARYDPPFKPWFLRRNEILIEVRT